MRSVIGLDGRINQVGESALDLHTSGDRGVLEGKDLESSCGFPEELYPELLQLLDKHWDGYTGVRAVCVGVDMLQFEDTVQLSLFDDVPKRKELYLAVDRIHERFGETSLMRAVSLTKAGQLRDRSDKIGGHYA